MGLELCLLLSPPSLGGCVDVTHARVRPSAQGMGIELLQSLWSGSLSLSKRKLQDQCAVAGGFASQLGSKGAWGENAQQNKRA